MTLKPIITLLITVAFLQGCSTQWLDRQPSSKAAVANNQAKPKPEEPERPFPIETFYALLVAELAGSRERYDIALGNYMQQAEKTRDPDIAARATFIARYLNSRKAALTCALLWVDISPNDLEARAIAASELIVSGQLVAATEHSNFLLEHGGTPLYQSIAARASTISERELLIEKFQQQLQNHPDNAELQVGLGLLYQQQNQYQLALNHTRQALNLNPDFVSAAVLQAKLLNSLGRSTEAIQGLADIVSANPKDISLRLQYARLLASTDLNKAQQEFQALRQLAPQDPEILFSLALVYYEQEMLSEAAELLELLSHLEQHSSSAHYYLGRIALKQKDWQAALEHMLRVEPGPHFMPALLQTTEILVSADQSASANKRLTAARERFPSQAERLYLLEAEVLNKHHQFDRAQIILDEGLDRYPASIQLLYSRAMVSEQLNHLDRLEADLRTILQYEPENASALNALGYTLADRTDRHTEALQLISQALKIKPDDPAILDSMGWVQYRLGNKQEAVRHLRQAMKAFPDAEIAAHLGEVLWVSGAQQEAQQAWSEGLALDPGNIIITETIKRLNATMPESSPNSTPVKNAL